MSDGTSGARDHVRCPHCEGCVTCGTHTAGVTCNGTSSTRQDWQGRAEAAEAKLAEIEKLNGHSGWLTPAEVQRRIWAITGG